jgi:hypothetical protein
MTLLVAATGAAGDGTSFFGVGAAAAIVVAVAGAPDDEATVLGVATGDGEGTLGFGDTFGAC